MTRIILILPILIMAGSCKNNVEQIVHAEDVIVQQAVNTSVEERDIKIEKIFTDLPTIDKVMGKVNPAVDTNFIRIDAQYTDKPAIFLQKESYAQFIKMHDAAAKEGVDLFILSATRPFNYQKNIWERKWAKLKAKGMTDEKTMVSDILKYSAMPGTSRHHWGTDIDLNYLNNFSFESGNGQQIYAWLTEHAHEYGFCQPYTTKGEKRANGYEEEKWHWSYMPIAGRYYQVARDSMKNEMISGFSGAAFAGDLQVVENFVLGVDPSCQ